MDVDIGVGVAAFVLQADAEYSAAGSNWTQPTVARAQRTLSDCLCFTDFDWVRRIQLKRHPVETDGAQRSVRDGDVHTARLRGQRGRRPAAPRRLSLPAHRHIINSAFP